MVTAFIIGLLSGFLVAIPPGPFSITVFTEGVKRRTGRALLVAAGGMIFEGIYSGAGFFGVQSLYSPSIELATRAVGSAFLVVTGAFYVRTKDRPESESEATASSRLRLLLFGAMLTGTAPTIIGGYVILAGLARSYGLFESSTENNLVATAGALVGSMAWIVLMLGLITRYHARLRSDIVNLIVRVAGIVLLIVGIGLGIRLIIDG